MKKTTQWMVAIEHASPRGYRVLLIIQIGIGLLLSNLAVIMLVVLCFRWLVVAHTPWFGSTVYWQIRSFVGILLLTEGMFLWAVLPARWLLPTRLKLRSPENTAEIDDKLLASRTAFWRVVGTLSLRHITLYFTWFFTYALLLSIFDMLIPPWLVFLTLGAAFMGVHLTWNKSLNKSLGEVMFGIWGKKTSSDKHDELT